MSIPEQVLPSKSREKTLVGALAWSPWGWGGVAFLIVGLAAAYVIPRPLGYLLAILGLVVCAATVAGEIVFARYTMTEIPEGAVTLGGRRIIVKRQHGELFIDRRLDVPLQRRPPIRRMWRRLARAPGTELAASDVPVREYELIFSIPIGRTFRVYLERERSWAEARDSSRTVERLMPEVEEVKVHAEFRLGGLRVGLLHIVTASTFERSLHPER